MASNLAFAARHSMDSPEWYTPAPFVDAARQVMGSIDLDPASHEQANETVQATRYYTEADNGLVLPWRDNVFCNPPGGLVDAFWKKFLAERDAIRQMVWIGYSLEQLQTLQTDNLVTPIDFHLCFPKRRIAFIENEAKRIARLAKIDAENEIRRAGGKKLKRRSEKADGPSHANYVAYVGYHALAFKEVFSQFGQVVLQ